MTALLQTPEGDARWGASHSLELVRKHWLFSRHFVPVPDMGSKEGIFCTTKLLYHKARRHNIYMRCWIITNHILSVLINV